MILDVLITIGYIALCVIFFSFAIAIHEFGHFIVALKLGLRVERFSIGFGPALWKRTWRGVEYRISAIPLGGYVSIPDVDPEGTKKLEGGASGVRAKVPAWKELLVAVAGPAMNIVLAVVLAFTLAAIPSANFGELPATIGDVIPGGPAADAGLVAGDTVRSVNGHPIGTWTEMQVEVQIAGEKEATFEIERVDESGKSRFFEVKMTPVKNEVNGAYFIKARSLTMEKLAASWMPSRNPLKQLAWDAGSIFRILKGLVTPKEMKSTSKALGGPVLIAEGIYRSVRRNPCDGLGFMRFLNVNLAIANLLPIPVLDGGLILFALIALVFRRRVPEKIVTALTMFFMYLLMGLMALLIVRDTIRSWTIHTAPSPKTVEVQSAVEDSPNVEETK